MRKLSQSGKIALISIGVNILLGIIKVTAGVLSGSIAVLSEGIHSGIDVLSSAICFAGIEIAKRPVDKNHPYGHYKYEVLAGVIITFILAITGIYIIGQSYRGFINPKIINISLLTLAVMLFSAFLNEIMARLKIHYGKKENILSLISEGVHSRADVLSSGGVFISLIITPYWLYADALLGLLIGLFILKESFFLGKEAVDSLLDVSAGDEVETKIKKIAGKTAEISEIKTQKKGSAITVSLKIKLPPKMTVKEASFIINDLKIKLREKIKLLTYITIQIEGRNGSSDYSGSRFAFGTGFGWQRFAKVKQELNGQVVSAFCVCPNCGFREEHQKAQPCTLRKCLKCGTSMVREVKKH